jgi:hypothetical protein
MMLPENWRIGKMENKKKAIATILLILSILSMALISTASAAGSITLTPSAQAPGGTVTVTGTSFGATKAIGIGLGSEVAVTGEAHTPTGSGTGPWMTRTNRYPIKPGSFSFHSSVVGSSETDFTDNGDGTMSTSSTYDAGSYLTYPTGAFGRSSTMDLSSSELIFTAAYTSYQYNVTPAGNPSSSATGTFTAIITIPAGLANGNYNVTAIDAGGTRAVATLTVNNTIPEVLPPGTLLLLAMFAVVAGVWFFRKRPTIKTIAV